MKIELLDLTLKLFCCTLDKLVYEPLTQGGQTLTEVQEHCLRFIYYHDQPLAKEVAEGLQISNAAVTKLIDRLEKRGLVERRYPRTDRRQVVLELTPTGLELLETSRRKVRQRLTEIIDRMAPEVRADLERGLQGFLDAALINTELIDQICLRCGRAHITDCPGNLTYRSLTGEDRVRLMKKEERR
ncbi:MAG: MarR family transcriptional regulator [Firmicutes bacterium]|nr:MarR family transcriptional regulator [Bacillota bacterium]